MRWNILIFLVWNKIYFLRIGKLLFFRINLLRHLIVFFMATSHFTVSDKKFVFLKSGMNVTLLKYVDCSTNWLTRWFFNHKLIISAKTKLITFHAGIVNFGDVDRFYHSPGSGKFPFAYSVGRGSSGFS